MSIHHQDTVHLHPITTKVRYLLVRVVWVAPWAGLAAAVVPGCAAAARVQLSSAESLDALANAVEQAVHEYHGDIRSADEARRRAVIDAFVQRVRGDHEDRQRVRQHVERFNQALDRIRNDAQVELMRRQATLSNVRAIREVAGGLRRTGIEAMTLDDELRRYASEVIERAGRESDGDVADVPPWAGERPGRTAGES